MEGKEKRESEKGNEIETTERDPVKQMKKGIRVHEEALLSTDSPERRAIVSINIARIYLTIALMTPNKKERKDFRKKTLQYLQEAEKALKEIKDNSENEELTEKAKESFNQIRLELKKHWTE